MPRIGSIVRAGRRLLRTEQGKAAGGKAVDGAAGVARRVAGDRHSARIEQARGAAQRALRGL